MSRNFQYAWRWQILGAVELRCDEARGRASREHADDSRLGLAGFLSVHRILAPPTVPQASRGSCSATGRLLELIRGSPDAGENLDGQFLFRLL